VPGVAAGSGVACDSGVEGSGVVDAVGLSRGGSVLELAVGVSTGLAVASDG